MATVCNPNGVDIYFLNREPIFNVRSSEELIHTFDIPPEGISHQYLLYKELQFE